MTAIASPLRAVRDSDAGAKEPSPIPSPAPAGVGTGRGRPAAPDDADLIGRVAAGDAQALSTLYDRYAGVVLAYGRRIVRDQEAAEDLLQEVFFRAWRQAGVYRPERGALVTWLLSITHNMAIDELRKRGRRPRKADGEDPEAVLVGVADADLGVEEKAWLGALRGEIATAMAVLPPPQRAALELAFFGGLTQREIAATLGAPLGTIKTRMRLGLDKLRVELQGIAA